jgi:hypothetical protein
MNSLYDTCRTWGENDIFYTLEIALNSIEHSKLIHSELHSIFWVLLGRKLNREFSVQLHEELRQQLDP